MGGDFAVHVRVDDHLIVEPVDAVVQHGAVRADLDSGRPGEAAEERQRVLDLGRDGVFPDPLIEAPLGDCRCVPVTEKQPDTGAVLALFAQCLEQAGFFRPATPKSRAGRRTVAFPEEIVPEISWHLERFAEPGERGFAFVGPKGGRLRRSNFHKSVWTKARAVVAMPELHFHDLRHTGGTLSAASGATLKELMARLGHSSVRAAMIYQHATAITVQPRLSWAGITGAGDGNRTRMTSLEGVLPRAARPAELGGSLSSVGRGWPVRTGVKGPLMAHPEAWVWALVRASSRLVRCSRSAGTWRAGDCKCG